MEILHFLFEEIYGSVNSCVQGIILTDAYIGRWTILRSALADDDLARFHGLAIALFET